MIPSIAFTVPDLDADATLTLTSSAGSELACISATATNGKTVSVPSVKYIAAGVAAGALALSGLSALASSGAPGASTPSPNFGEVIGWFQTMATSGMYSVNYPKVYRSFTSNFASSTGLVPWTYVQTSIDNFRESTGGNLTEDSYTYLQSATLVYSAEGDANGTTYTKRALESLLFSRDLFPRDSNSTTSVNHLVSGIEAYAEKLSIPQANTFMTVLLVFSIILAAIAVGILLFKVILEAWAIFGNLPQSLSGFRKDYWGILARTITQLVLLLYGTWTLYCIYQFTEGDSWAAKLLAGLTLGIFTALLGFFTFRIWQLANRYKKLEGDTSALYENEETWRKYSLFYDNYKRGYWWVFVPAILYMFAKGVVIAAGNGHGLYQTGGQLVIEGLMLILLLWKRPFVEKRGNWINISISVVRVLSVVCILIFVEELGISQTASTVTGIVLIAVQASLTGILAILIAVNAIIICIRENPHRKRRLEAGKSKSHLRKRSQANNAPEKMDRDMDNLTPLDARNSLLMEPTTYKSGMHHVNDRGNFQPYHDMDRKGHRESTDNLIAAAAPLGSERDHSRDGRDHSPYHDDRQPTIPRF